VQGVPQWPALPDSKSLSVKKKFKKRASTFFKSFFWFVFQKTFFGLEGLKP
jgi:hypothetical protein